MLKVPVYSQLETFKVGKDSEYGFLEKFDVVKNSITGKCSVVIYLKQNGVLNEYPIFLSEMVDDFELDLANLNLDAKYDFQTQQYFRAEIVEWWNGKDMSSISTESGIQPFKVRRLSDNQEFKVGDIMKYPEINLIDEYKISSFRIESIDFRTIRKLQQILINNHASIRGARSINNWEFKNSF